MFADLGAAELASADDRFQSCRAATEWKNCFLPICTAEYRSPEVFLGSLHFGKGLDLWSLGCVAAELFLRRPLFQPKTNTQDEELHARKIIDSHFEFLGVPSPNTSAHRWMKSLPRFAELCDSKKQHLAKHNANKPSERLIGCPRQLADFVDQVLQWQPQDRPSAASASEHAFLNSPVLSVATAVSKGKHGLGSIVEGSLDEDVLEYLQNDPAWAQFHAESLRKDSENSGALSLGEKDLGMKHEFVGYIDADAPPRCRSLNGDAQLGLIRSERLVSFVKALRRRLKNWLDQLTVRVRNEIVRQGLPPEFLCGNGQLFLNEDFAENAFAYASVQLMKSGEREDGWHTDGGASLLHASLTVFGNRQVQVKLEDGRCISLPQRPGSFYIGSMCALEHNVQHSEHPVGCYGEPSEQVQIAVMLRCDVFRAARARKKNCTPGPAEVFRIVNDEVAKHLAEQALSLPDLAGVLAEARAGGGLHQPEPVSS